MWKQYQDLNFLLDHVRIGLAALRSEVIRVLVIVEETMLMTSSHLRGC